MAKKCDGKQIIPCEQCKDHMKRSEELKSSYDVNMVEIKNDIKYIKEKLDSNSEMIKSVIEKKADKEYVDQIRASSLTIDKSQSIVDRLDRLEKLVYGVVTIVGTAIILAIIKLVILS